MTFSDTNVGDKVLLTVNSGDNQMVFETTILNIVDNCLVVEPIIHEGAMLQFPYSVVIEMLVIHPDSTPLYWKRVFVDIKVYHEMNCHVIKTNLPGIKFNRRNNFRVYIGMNAKMSGEFDKTLNVTLKDVSNSGFAVLINKGTQIELHKKINIEFTDNSLKKFIELSGRPIRTLETDSHNLYGCILDKRYPELESYISQKQMENRPNRRIEF